MTKTGWERHAEASFSGTAATRPLLSIHDSVAVVRQQFSAWIEIGPFPGTGQPLLAHRSRRRERLLFEAERRSIRTAFPACNHAEVSASCLRGTATRRVALCKAGGSGRGRIAPIAQTMLAGMAHQTRRCVRQAERLESLPCPLPTHRPWHVAARILRMLSQLLAPVGLPFSIDLDCSCFSAATLDGRSVSRTSASIQRLPVLATNWSPRLRRSG